MASSAHPWAELKRTEVRVLERRAAGQSSAPLVEALRRLLVELVERDGEAEAGEAVCYHGAWALVHEHDGRIGDAIRHRTIEIEKIERLHELVRQDECDRAALAHYEETDLALRREILNELRGRV